MIVIPAIDLRGGRCVRLVQGDFNRETVFDADPIAVARRWERAGARLIHVVDLDGAREGEPRQLETIAGIASAVGVPLQVGGGVRSAGQVEALVEAGARRIVVGTAAVENPDLIDELLARHGPERIVLGVDARGGSVATRGWLDTSDVAADDLVAAMRERGIMRVIYTDIERDGTLTAPNFEAIAAIGRLGVRVIASGGVSRTEHIERLAGIPGVEAVIVGRALYTGDIQMDEAGWAWTPGAAGRGSSA